MAMDDDGLNLAPLLPAVEALAAALRDRGWRLATAESCTGGLIAGACTALAGSSDWFERGVVTYSNASKTEWLGVPAEVLVAHGAVSEPVARAMAEGVRERAGVPLAVAVTGIAGPGGATPGKPVGLVWFGLARLGAPTLTWSVVWPGDRAAVRRATVADALRAATEAARGPA
jgi:nicotinamide-nucleotide amidase